MNQNPYALKQKNTTPLVSRKPIVTPYVIPTPTENSLYNFGEAHTPNIMTTQPYNSAISIVDFDNKDQIPVVNLHSEFIRNCLLFDTSTMKFQGISFGYIQILNDYQHDGPELFEVNIEADDQEVAVQLKSLPNNEININIIYFHKHLRRKWFVKHTQIKDQESSTRKRYKPTISLHDTDKADNTSQRKIHSEFISRHLALHRTATFVPPISFGYTHILNNYCHEGPRPFDVNVEDEYEEFAIQFIPLPNNNTKITMVHFYKRPRPTWNVKYTNSTE
jgi:hypothetical protein